MSNEHVNYHVPEFSIFTTARFGRDTIRYACDKNNEPWWVIEDACYALGMSFDQAISSLMVCNDEIRIHDCKRLTNRPGVYNLIELSGISNKEAFRKFIKKQTICDWKAEATVPVPVESAQSVETQDFASLQPVDCEIAGVKKQTINLRELNSFLNSGQKFSDWIKNRIETYGFKEGEDFVSFREIHKREKDNDINSFRKTANREIGSGASVSVEYYATLDMAKELAMVERTETGRKVRQYFIACEEQLMKDYEIKLRTQLALPDPSIIATAKKQAAANGMKLHERLDEMGIGTHGLAKLCFNRQVNHHTQRECARLMGITREQVQELERYLKTVGIEFAAINRHKKLRDISSNFKNMFGLEEQPPLSHDNPLAPFSKGECEEFEEVAHV